MLLATLVLTACPTDDGDGGDGTTTVSTTATTGPTSSGSADDSTTADTTPGTGSGDSGSGSGSDSGDSGSGDSTGGPVVCGTPGELGMYAPPEGAAEGFVVDGTTVYLASTSGGLFVVDVSDPAAPSQLGQYDFGSGNLAHRVANDGTTVYVGMRGAGWSVVDASDPGNIIELATDDTVDAQDVAVAGSTLLVADNNGLLSYDVTDPSTPTPLTVDLVLPGSSETIEVAGDVAFVASAGAGLSAVDISDPGALMELSSLSIGNGAERLAVEGTTVYVAHSEGVSIVDATDSAMLTEVGSYVRERAWALDTDGTKVFVTGDDTASIQVPFLAVIDATDPAAVVELDVAADDYDDPHWLVFDAGLLYATVEDDDTLRIFDACPR